MELPTPTSSRPADWDHIYLPFKRIGYSRLENGVWHKRGSFLIPDDNKMLKIDEKRLARPRHPDGQPAAEPKVFQNVTENVFKPRLPDVQAASRRMQTQLEIHDGTSWPLPPLPANPDVSLIEINAKKMQEAIENCKSFAVVMTRSSEKGEFLDEAVTKIEKRVVLKKSDREEKTGLEVLKDEVSASEVEGGMQQEEKEVGMKEDGEMRDHSLDGGTEVAPGSHDAMEGMQTSGEPSTDFSAFSSTDSSLKEEPLEASSILAPESSVSNATDNKEHRHDDTSLFSHEVQAGTSGPPHHGRFPIRTLMESAQHLRQAEAMVDIGTPVVFEELDTGIENVHDEVGTQYPKITKSDLHSMSNGIVSAPTALTAIQLPYDDNKEINTGPVHKDKGKASQLQNPGKDNANNIHLEQKPADTATCQGNDDDDSTSNKANVKPKKTRNPVVPLPDNMPGDFTEVLCNYNNLNVGQILTLTLEDVDPLMTAPMHKRNVLLHHFEVGLDGVEGMFSGTVTIPESPDMKLEREKRLQELGTVKKGQGGYSQALKKEQTANSHGKGIWLFCAVKFKQTAKEKRNRKMAKWLCLGAPVEACSILEKPEMQEFVPVTIGGGKNRSGKEAREYRVILRRSRNILCKGGIAPMDIWPGGDDWEDGVFQAVRESMANNGLRMSFLYNAGSEITCRQYANAQALNEAIPRLSVLKRKDVPKEMTPEEVQAAEAKIAQGQKTEVNGMLASLDLHEKIMQGKSDGST